MLSYQHGYHAGSFADVVKHLTLTNILTYMVQKEQPLMYLDTHSGRGIYDLTQKQSQKTNEYQNGIEIIWQNKFKTELDTYLKIVKKINNAGKLRYYPGSPEIALNILRECDRAILCDLHPKEFQHLEELTHPHKKIFRYQSNGLDQLKALTPPIEKRGLIFIDPSYEMKNEYRDIASHVQDAYKRFATGVYCIWYPLIDNKSHLPLLRGLSAISKKSLHIEFFLEPITSPGMHGCGLWVINPPYVLEQQMKTNLQILQKHLNPNISKFTMAC